MGQTQQLLAAVCSGQTPLPSGGRFPDFSSKDQFKPLLLGLKTTSARVQVAPGSEASEPSGLTALFLKSARVREDEIQGTGAV